MTFQGLRRDFPWLIGMAKFDPPKSRTMAKLIPMTRPSPDPTSRDRASADRNSWVSPHRSRPRRICDIAGWNERRPYSAQLRADAQTGGDLPREFRLQKLGSEATPLVPARPASVQ